MKYTDWVLKTIREEDIFDSWLEELRFTVAPLFQNILQKIEKGTTVLVINDNNRTWFSEYITSNINSKTDRPLFPFIKFESIIQNQSFLNSKDGISLVEDMLSIAFPNGYIFWYVGISNTQMASLAKNKDDSFVWLMDEELPNCVHFSSKDALLDVKLLQLFKLFDKSLSATIYGDFELPR